MRFKQPNPRSACPANSMKLRMGRPCACPIKGENTNAAMANRAIRNVTTTIGATTRVAPTASSPIAHLEGGVFSFFSIQGISRHAPSCGLQEIVARIHWPATVPRMRRCCGFWGRETRRPLDPNTGPSSARGRASGAASRRAFQRAFQRTFRRDFLRAFPRSQIRP